MTSSPSTPHLPHPALPDAPPARPATRRVPLAAGLLLGIGLGGLVDGIVLHQLLQWHGLLWSAVPPSTVEALRYNVRWDGAFNGAIWVVTLVGVAVLARAAARNPQAARPGVLIGDGLLGWGGFNLIEGLFNHQLLGLHHVEQLAPSHAPGDAAFLALGAGLMVVGLLLGRSSRLAAARDDARSA